MEIEPVHGENPEFHIRLTTFTSTRASGDIIDIDHSILSVRTSFVTFEEDEVTTHQPI
jgi:hypothetical protein